MTMLNNYRNIKNDTSEEFSNITQTIQNYIVMLYYIMLYYNILIILCWDVCK